MFLFMLLQMAVILIRKAGLGFIKESARAFESNCWEDRNGKRPILCHGP